jgi:hypothetical protein
VKPELFLDFRRPRHPRVTLNDPKKSVFMLAAWLRDASGN